MIRTRIAACAFAFALAACGGFGGDREPPDTPITGVNYVSIVVNDLDRSEALLYQATNLTPVEGPRRLAGPHWDDLVGREGVEARTTLLRGANAQVQLIEFDERSAAAEATPPMGVQGPGIAHLCIQALKETETYQTFLRGGAAVIGDPDMVQLNPRNPVEYAYVRSPDGVVFEIEHVDVSQLDLDEPPKNTHRIRHVALATPDLDRAVAFYSILFDEPNPRYIGRLGGFSGENIDKVSGLEGSKIKMAWFQARNLELEISQYVSHPTEVPHDPRPLDALGLGMIVYDVNSVEAARERLIEAGARSVTEIISADGGQIVFARDPDGNLLGFQKVPSTSVFSSQHFADNGI
ncbi:MAG: VOC family protein [Pseudomonadota bacterium]